MADGSARPYADNVEFVRRAAELAARSGAGVECELGGITGDEDVAEAVAAGALTDPAEAVEFMAATGADCLAVSIGNVHGVYRDPPDLDWARLAAIRSGVTQPLSLHGASGIPPAMLQRAIDAGIAKVNVNTELRQRTSKRRRRRSARPSRAVAWRPCTRRRSPRSARSSTGSSAHSAAKERRDPPPRSCRRRRYGHRRRAPLLPRPPRARVAAVDFPPEVPVSLTYLDLGNAWLQLVEPLDPAHPLATWLETNGEGLHHLCFGVDDVECELRRIGPARGCRAAARERPWPAGGVRGRRSAARRSHRVHGFRPAAGRRPALAGPPSTKAASKR